MPQWRCLLKSADGLIAYHHITKDHLPPDIQTALLYDLEPRLLLMDPSDWRRFPMTRLYSYHHTSMEGDTYVYHEVAGWAEKELEREKKLGVAAEVAAQRVIANCIMDGQHELALEMNRSWNIVVRG